jgi:hypothetical protein
MLGHKPFYCSIDYLLPMFDDFDIRDQDIDWDYFQDKYE